MNTLQIYDPAMCCSTGICGPDVDPELANFASLLSQLQQRGVKVERYNLGQRPVAFAQNAQVKTLLETDGVEALPAIFQNGELLLKGRHPTREERGEWIRLLLKSETKSGDAVQTAGAAYHDSTPPSPHRHAICFSRAKAGLVKRRWRAPRPCASRMMANAYCW